MSRMTSSSTCPGSYGRVGHRICQTRVTIPLILFAIALGLCAIATGDASADIVIDLGRGPVPVRVPSVYDTNVPMPLVMALHGHGSSAQVTEEYLQFAPLADELGFLHFYPEGLVDSVGNRFWNATPACCDYYGSNVDDSGYLDSLIVEVQARLNVDPRRIYVIGASNGGFMSHRMACDHAETIAAIGSLAGAAFYDPADCQAADVVNVLEMHGTEDTRILYEGGIDPGSGLPYPGAVETVEQWATHNGCSLLPDTSQTRLDLDASIPGEETIVIQYDVGCDPGGSAELWSIVGAGHIPTPSSQFSPLLVEYLLSHPKDGYSVVMILDSPALLIGGADEVVSFSGEIRNLGPIDDFYDITVSGLPPDWIYACTTPAGTFSGPSTLSLPSGETASFTLELDAQGNPGPAVVRLQARSQHEPLNMASRKLSKLNGLQVLLVDDDGGQAREEYVESGIAATGATWGTWDLSSGDLTAADLQNAASSVIWMCGTAFPTLTPNDRAALGTFMDDGGRAFVSGADVAYDLCAGPNSTPESTQWYGDYLHAAYGTNSSFVWDLAGTPGDPIGHGYPLLSIALLGENGQSTPDGITAGPGADIVFTYLDNQWEAGVRWEGGSTRVVYFGFGIEGVASETDRNEVIRRIVEWFGVSTSIAQPSGPESVSPMVQLARSAPNPTWSSTSIHYTLSRSGSASIRIYDVSGRLVRELVSGHHEAMTHRVVWDGRDDLGQDVGSGVYFYQLEVGASRETQRVIRVR